jgi:hypothetical protein
MKTTKFKTRAWQILGGAKKGMVATRRAWHRTMMAEIYPCHFVPFLSVPATGQANMLYLTSGNHRALWRLLLSYIANCPSAVAVTCHIVDAQ